MAEGETELMPLAITAVEPGNKHKEDTAADVVVAVVETELNENLLTEGAINNDKSKEEGEKDKMVPPPSTSDRHRRHSSIDAHSLKFISKRSSNITLLQRQNKKSLNSPHPVKHYQVRVTERGQKATCTLLTLEMPRLIEANHHSA
jgi:hypothetical protein